MNTSLNECVNISLRESVNTRFRESLNTSLRQNLDTSLWELLPEHSRTFYSAKRATVSTRQRFLTLFWHFFDWGAEFFRQFEIYARTTLKITVSLLNNHKMNFKEIRKYKTSIYFSFLFVDIYKNMHVAPLFVSRHFRAPGGVSIFNSSRENKYVLEIQ